MRWLDALVQASKKVDEVAAKSIFGRYFRLEGSGHPLAREGARFITDVRAGLVTFTAMAYILSVNSSILTLSGGPCECKSPNFCRDDPGYQACTNDLHQAYIVATAAASCVASGLMGLMANMPLGLAPGLGANAYFALTIVGEAGSGTVSYGQALAVVWLEGGIFVILSVLGVRQWLARALPASLKASTAAGIGVYLAFIGLGPNGLGVVGLDYSTIVGIGGCPQEYKDQGVTGLACMSHQLQDLRVWVGIFLGGVVMALLLMYRVRGALIIGILLVSISSWPRGSSVTQFPHTESGDQKWDFFKKVATWRSISPLGPSNIHWHSYNSGHAWLALISFLYIDLLDTTGTLYAMATQAKLVDARTGDFEGSSTAYISDAVSIATGSLLGCSPCTAFIESLAGIVEGGRTGIVALTIAFMFFLSLFFAPIFSSFPPWATGPVLVIVGSMMMTNAAEVNWWYMGDAIPAFLTIVGIPLMYNIAYGLIAGILSYVILNVLPWLLLRTTGGRLMPDGWDSVREPWGSVSGILPISEDMATRKFSRFQLFILHNSIFPMWLKKIAIGRYKFWELTPAEIEDTLEGRRETHRRLELRERQRQLERREQRAVLMPRVEEDPEAPAVDPLLTMPELRPTRTAEEGCPVEAPANRSEPESLSSEKTVDM